MNTPLDPETSAVEKMLHDRARQSPPPALRTRVLTAVDNVLPKMVPAKKVPGTTYGKAANPHPPENADLVVVTFLMGTVLSLLIIVMLSSEVASRRIGGTTEPPLLSFAQRAEAAGITLDVMPPATVQLAVGLPRDTAVPRYREPFHVLDTRTFLQGDL